MATLIDRLTELKTSKNLLQKDIASGIGLSLRTYQRYPESPTIAMRKVNVNLLRHCSSPLRTTSTCRLTISLAGATIPLSTNERT